MLHRKKKSLTLKPFSRIIPTRWLIEYSGILPHSARQGVPICHELICCRVNEKHSRMLRDEGVELLAKEHPTHVLWCFCKLNKDHDHTRLLFRRYLDISTVTDQDYQDWISFKLTQHLQARLMAIDNFRYLIPCVSSREYYWCARGDDFQNYWETETNVRFQGLMKVIG